MHRLRIHIWLMLCLLFPLSVEGQTASAVDTTAMMRNDYITASLLVVDPSSEVYSMFGHCALRLECPTHDMDYCFTFEMSTDYKAILGFITGKSLGAFKPAPTQEYLDYYRKEQRGVTQYPLNLTPTEKLQLWKQVDKEVALGFCYPYGYMHTQCTSKLVWLIASALPAPIGYTQLPSQLEGSFRDQMLAESANYPWSRFFWQTIMGPEGDATEPLEQKLTPHTLPLAWQHTTIGDERRPLITGQGETLVPSVVTNSCDILTPTRACTLLFFIVIIVTLLQHYHKCRWLVRLADGLLLVIYTALALLLAYLILFSQQEGTGWNWYLPAFNPLPLLLWLVLPRWRRWILGCWAVIFLVSILLTPFIPQFDLPHALLMGCFLIRLCYLTTYHVINNK